jgi:hypothetical protein
MVIRMRRSALMAVPLTVAVLAAPTWAVAQQSQGTTTSGSTPTTGASTTPTTPRYTGPPKLSALRLSKVVTSQQGHARFMLGMRSAGPITVTVKITSVKGKKLVRTMTSAADHPQGAVWFLVQAVNDQGYQLVPGA